MPRPPYEPNLGSLLGSGQAGNTGIIPSVDRGRDAGTRTPRSGVPWQSATADGEYGTWYPAQYITQTLSFTISSTPTSFARDDFSVLSITPQTGVLALTLTVDDLTGPPVDLGGPRAWCYWSGVGGSSTRRIHRFAVFGSDPGQEDSAPPLLFNWGTQSNFGCAAGVQSVSSGWSGDGYVRLDLWTPGYFT